MNELREELKQDLLLAVLFGLIIGIYIAGMLYHAENKNKVGEVAIVETTTEHETTEPEVIIEPITTEELAEPEYRREVTDEEYQLMLRVCMSECGGRNGEPIEGKIAVVETILNRVDMGMGSISQVVSQAYSTAYNGEPDETVVQAVEIALTGDDDFPDNMIAFRTGTYHSFGTPYKKIGNHYFSLVEVEGRRICQK